MEKDYWIGRKRAAMAMARAAGSAEARLGYYELAGRCSINAAQCPPFLLVRRDQSPEGERGTLFMAGLSDLRDGSMGRGPLPRTGDARAAMPAPRERR